MEPTKRYTSGRGWRVTTPSFPGFRAADDFYEKTHRLIEKDFAAIRERGERGFLVADFFASKDGGDTVITLRLRLRENGRYVAEKTLVHRWRGGYIAPKREYPRVRGFVGNIISKIEAPYKRKNKSGEKSDENGR